MGWAAENDPSITPSNNTASMRKLVPRSAGKVPWRFAYNEYCDPPHVSEEHDRASDDIVARRAPTFFRGCRVREFRLDFSITQWPHLSKSLATTIRLHTSELITGDMDLEKSLQKVVNLFTSVDKAAEFRTSEGLGDKTNVWQVFSVVLKEYARAVAIYIQEHAKGKYVRLIPAELRNLHELYVRNYSILFEGDVDNDNARELIYSKTEYALAMLVEATRERSIEDRGKMPSEILVNLVNTIDAERTPAFMNKEDKNHPPLVGFVEKIPKSGEA